MEKAETPARAWGVYLSGLVAAVAVAAWMRPPAERSSFGKSAVIAAVWIFATVLSGVVGVGVAESFIAGGPRIPRMKSVMAAVATWVLLPPMLLCWVRGSGWAAAMSAVGGAAAAMCLWGMTPRDPEQDGREPWAEGPRFADLPKPDSGRAEALAIAVCVELAVVLANREALLFATVLTAVAGFLLGWKQLASLNAKVRDGMSGPATRAAGMAVLAMLIVIPLLLARLMRMDGSMETTAQAATRPNADQGKGESDAGEDAYRGIILFTVKDKRKELPPVPLERDLLRTGTAKPLVIPFDGSYWYFQAPREGPGLHPHLAHGDPVAVSIYSTGWVPLAMQAHQTLAAAVDLRTAGAMQVTVRNGDNRRGRIDLGVLLTDSTTPGKPSMYLGTEPLLSSEAEHFTVKANPLSEEIGFAIPERRGIRKFDEITVLFFPGEERATMGARMGIEQFELMPKGRE